MENNKETKSYTKDELVKKIIEHNKLMFSIWISFKTNSSLEMLRSELKRNMLYHTDTEYSALIYEISAKAFIDDISKIDADTIEELEDLLYELDIPESEIYSKEELIKEIEKSNNAFKEANALRDKINLLCITSSGKLDFIKYYDQLYIEL